MDPMIIGAATVVFTGVILGLTAILMVARSQLVSQGEVTILLNDDPSRSPKVQPGQSLLSALAANKIFVPSACGGGGTCAMCRCQVFEGGGEILPTETGHLSKKEQKDHWRLSCQVKVKTDMKVKVPDEIFGIQKFSCTVKSNDNVATFIKELVLEIDGGQNLHFESGGYIQIDIPRYELSFKDFAIDPQYHEDWDKFNLWRYKAQNKEDGFYRAYSMANHPGEGNIVMLNVRIATPPPKVPDAPPGVASSYIFNLKPGDKVQVSGPYGEFHINPTQREMIYIGGGAGMAPLRSHIFHLFHTERTTRKVQYWYGARSLREMFYWEDFQKIEKEFPNFKMNIALSEPKPEDNWTSYVGFIHQVLLKEYLSKHEAPEDIEYYLCGPPMMNTAVRKMLDDLGVPDEMIRFDDFGG